MSRYTLDAIIYKRIAKTMDANARPYFLATNMKDSRKRVLRLYNRRWGIETSCHKIGEFFPKTMS